jgi:hypothetical protein
LRSMWAEDMGWGASVVAARVRVSVVRLREGGRMQWNAPDCSGILARERESE